MRNISLKFAMTALCLVAIAGTTNSSQVARAAGEPSYTAFTEGLASFTDDRDKKEVSAIAKALGKKMNFFESPNFTWCTSLPKGKMTKIMSEAERCYNMFAVDAGYKSWKKFWSNGRKCMGVILANKRDYRKYVKWFANNNPVWSVDGFIKNHSGSNWFTEPSDQSRNVMVTHLKPNDAIFVAAVMCHLVGHHCVDRHKFNNNFTPGWLRESMGLYFQGEVHGRLQCASYDDPYGLGEGDEARQKGLKKAEFKTRVKKSMAKNRLRNTKNVFQLSTMKELTFLDTQKGHLMVSWMMKKKGRLSKFIHSMKSNWPATVVMENTKGKEKAQEKALKAVFDLTPPEADKALKKFASSGY
ncbi:MAG: hypothetical protein ACI97A_003466 [Planctomycetota bacterium]|jgi:hypothetical protein